MRAVLGPEEVDPEVVSWEFAGMLVVQEYLCLWFLSRALESLEENIEDAGERWKRLRRIVEEAMDVSEAYLNGYGSAMTALGSVARRHLREIVRKRFEEALARLAKAGSGDGAVTVEARG